VMWHAMGASGSHSTSPTGSGRCLSGRSQNTLLYSHSQLPPQFGPYKLSDFFEKNGRFPVSCARGEMKTQLFKVSKDPQQLGDRAPDNPEIVATLKRQAADFLRSVGAPTGLCVSVS
jgi:hypothetical protein